MGERVKKGLVPALRFPEFRDAGEWEDNNFYNLLEEVLDFRGRTPKKLGMDWGGDIVSLSANNVKNGYIDFYAECNLGSSALYEKWMGKVSLEKNDIVFTMEAPLGNALLVPDSQKYILSQRVVAFKTKKNINNAFLIQLIWSHSFQNKIQLLSTGSTAKGINQKTLKTVQVRIPREIKEQQKIADCLSSLDELIAAHTKKHEALQSYKKGLMQNLFPAEGETVPALRFPGFRDAGEWNTDIFANFIEIIDGDRGKNYPKSDEFNDAGYCLFLNAKNVTKNGFVFEEMQFISEEKDNCLRKGKLKRDDVVLTTRGSVGQFAFFSGEIPYSNIRINSGMVLLRSKFKSIRPDYLYMYCKSESISNYIGNIAFGNAQQQLTVAGIKTFPLCFPSGTEQQKIADCLSSVDKLITAQAQRVEDLKAHKKGLMQQLFPGTEAVGT